MSKRLIFALGLSMLILFFFNTYFYKTSGQRRMIEEEKWTPDQPALPAPEKPGQTREEIPSVPEEESLECIMLETALFKVFFSPHGEIKSCQLKKFKNIDGSLVELIPASETSSLKISALKEEDAIFYQLLPDVEIRREFIFDEDKYAFRYRVHIHNKKQEELSLVLWKWESGLKSLADLREYSLTSYAQQKIVRKRADKIKNSIIQAEDVSWTGLGGKYFVIALVPGQGDGHFEIETKEQVSGRKVEKRNIILTRRERIPALASVQREFIVYAGPRDYEILKQAQIKGLEDLVDFGFFGFLGKTILWLLKLFYRFTRNYGVAIILVSVLVKVLLSPLTRLSFKSMRDMQRIQPQINILRQRYRHDPQRFNQEVMDLYRRLKVNPMGGCLPLLLQMPIFWALFIVFQNAIELRQASFILWIKDLSTYDPYYILPILMGISMFVQQKISTTKDSPQAGMMAFMPIFFTFIFLKFPAGLVLYWLVSNLLSIGEQYSIHRKK